MRTHKMPTALPESGINSSRTDALRSAESPDFLVLGTETRRAALSRNAAMVPEESLVDDGRSRLTPAQMVESKLMTLLQGASLPVSQLQMRGLVRNYRQS